MILINANSLLNKIPQPKEHDEMISRNGAIADMILLVSWEPAVDAVPIVRCKDCKNLKILNDKEVYAICKNKTFYSFEDDTRTWYCADGERKKENNNND